jgi:hypothetical protein
MNVTYQVRGVRRRRNALLRLGGAFLGLVRRLGRSLRLFLGC